VTPEEVEPEVPEDDPEFGDEPDSTDVPDEDE
jgi:hypothetical protein